MMALKVNFWTDYNWFEFRFFPHLIKNEQEKTY